MSEEDNRRQVLIIKLANGSATQQERDEAISMMLMSLWSEKDLTERIQNCITERMKNCKKWDCVLSQVITNSFFWVFLTVLAFSPNCVTIIGAIAKFFK